MIVATPRGASTRRKVVNASAPSTDDTSSKEGIEMEVVYERCCGLDVHKKSVTACVLITEADGSVKKSVRTFPTMTADLLALGDWLTSLGVRHLAMESTGIYTFPMRL
jgi:hypothetical protein